MRSPLRYLLGKTKLEKELEGLSLAPIIKPVNPGDVVLRGVPKGMRDRVAQTLLEVAPDGLIVRIVVEEFDGSSTEFRFLQQRENVEIPDQQFRFAPPPGVEVVAGTEFMEWISAISKLGIRCAETEPRKAKNGEAKLV